MNAVRHERLLSLDILRGLDMLFLCVVQPLVWTASKAWGFADVAAHPWMRQFDHPWGGFTAYDLIMPLFIFMCGAAIPFALAKRLDGNGRPTAAYFRHVFGRVALLWVLGCVAGGSLLSLDPMRISPYNNTLQAIAAGYLLAALVYPLKSRWARWGAPVALMLAYGGAMALWGDYSRDGNLAIVLERKILGALVPAGSQAFDLDGYTWFFTSLMFGAMTLCGMVATELLQSSRPAGWKVGRLAVFGVGLLVSGFLLQALGVPSIKQFFSVSFTAKALGVCVLLLDALYVLTDVWRCRRGWGLAVLYGQTALACYMLGIIFSSMWNPAGTLDAASRQLLQGLTRFVAPETMPFFVQAGVCVLLTGCLFVWRGFKAGKNRRPA